MNFAEIEKKHTFAEMQNSLCWFSSSWVSASVAPGDVWVAR